MLTVIRGKIAYCAINAGNKVNLYHVENKRERTLIASFPIDEILTYFSFSEDGVIINSYLCNPITETIKPYVGVLPHTPHTVELVKVTFRSKRAILADFTFVGPSFSPDMKSTSIPLNIRYNITGQTVTECSLLGNHFIGESDIFLSEVLGGSLVRLDLISCYRNHVYREYDEIISVCETCNKTMFLGSGTYKATCLKPTTKVVVIPNCMHHIFGRGGTNNSALLMFKDGELFKVYNGDEYIYDKIRVNEEKGFNDLAEFYELNC